MIKGLNKEQIEESRKLYGDNIIHEAEPETFWDKFKGAFDDPMIKLLLAIAPKSLFKEKVKVKNEATNSARLKLKKIYF